ncbi:MAG: hypothetical protein IPM36_07650 [Lewinellaceae bacterium]|nr:hypothetical protein [Lewinellaceae bacterium]
MKPIFYLPALLFFFLISCRPAPPESLPLPTEICVTTVHHSWPIPEATVYVKYNADSFPGYKQPDAYFDAIFKTGKDGRGCLAPVPEGRHWLVALGYDSLYYPHDVMGNMPVTISLDGIAKFDSIIYVSEKH